MQRPAGAVAAAPSLPRFVRNLVKHVRAVRRCLAAWHARRAMRLQLREDLHRLDDRALRDVGVTRRDLMREAYRPFWKR